MHAAPLFELETQIVIAAKLGYMQTQPAAHLLESVTEVARILNGLLTLLRGPSRKISTKDVDSE